jgi:hypothetical protein
LIKKTKDLFSENYKLLKGEIKKDIRRWKDLPWSWIGRINNVKMAISNLHVQCNLNQNLNDSFHRKRKINPRIHVQTKSPQIPKAIMSKRPNTEGITIPAFKLFYRDIIIKTAWHCH